MKESIYSHLSTLREKSPLVHNITNDVVMNNTANALLAIGASPIMSHAHAEVEDMVKIIHALVINIGTLDEYLVDSMLLASKKAVECNKPWILDPVGAGATPYRNETLDRLLAFHPSVIRGNASEIMSMAKMNIQSKGVDSSNTSEEALDAGIRLAKNTNAVVCISGAIDYVISENKIARIHNGSPLMGKVTGMGCTASALIGAFAGCIKNTFEATVSAMSIMGIAGEIAAEQAKGPGTLQLHFYDALYQLEEKEILHRSRLDI